MKDYYQALGISESASIDEIKKAYREIAKKYHPDRNPGDKTAEERFKEASEAYETLSDKEKRAKYDQLRKFGAGGAGGGRGFGFNGGSGGAGGIDLDEYLRQYEQRTSGGGSTRETSWGFGESVEDLFGNLFGGTRSARRTRTKTAERDESEPQPTDDPFFKRKGNDAYVDLNINLAQALLGSKVRVRTPAGKKVTITVQPGTGPEKTLRVPGMGYHVSNGAGDLYVRLHLVMPKELNEDQREMVRQLAESLGMKY